MSKQIPPLYSFCAFDAVASHTSYTLAANELGVTSAAVKQDVLRFENDLGAKLVERRGTKILLTEVGKAGHVDVELATRFITNATWKIKKAIVD